MCEFVDATHNHLVSEPSTRFPQRKKQEAWLRIVQSLALLPYPRPLTWCCTPPHDGAAVARALRSFPQFGCVAQLFRAGLAISFVRGQGNHHRPFRAAVRSRDTAASCESLLLVVPFRQFL